MPAGPIYPPFFGVKSDAFDSDAWHFLIRLVRTTTEMNRRDWKWVSCASFGFGMGKITILAFGICEQSSTSAKWVKTG